MAIPIFNRLKKRLHRETAFLQDELVEIVYSVSSRAVLHGGTSIWRCYSGNRFSEDLDFYLADCNSFKEPFFKATDARGLTVLKFKKTANNIFSRVSNGVVEVRLEAACRKIKDFEVGQYEKADGSPLNVFTLSPENLVLEKIDAYSSRKLVRDFFDIFVLTSLQLDNKKIAPRIKMFLSNVQKPVDEKQLKAIVFSGAVPSFEQMLFVLKRRFGV